MTGADEKKNRLDKIRRVLNGVDIKVYDYLAAFKYVNTQSTYEGALDFALISIQDYPSDLTPYEYRPVEKLKSVLTIHFSDIEYAPASIDGVARLMTDWDADNIIKFVSNLKDIKVLVIHCYAGVSRSAAVAAALSFMLNGDSRKYFWKYAPNKYVYTKLLDAVGLVDNNDYTLR